MGVVIGEDGLTTTINTQGDVKTVSHRVFTRWYTVVEEEKSNVLTEKKKKPVKGTRFNPSGTKNIGVQIADHFFYLVKDMANQDLDITVDNIKKKVIIKYNNKNIFECTTTKYRFSVLCHPASLTAHNTRAAFKIFPKEWGWALRAKFVFTTLDEYPLMKSIITDALFYRQIKVEIREEM